MLSSSLATDCSQASLSLASSICLTLSSDSSSESFSRSALRLSILFWDFSRSASSSNIFLSVSARSSPNSLISFLRSARRIVSLSVSLTISSSLSEYCKENSSTRLISISNFISSFESSESCSLEPSISAEYFAVSWTRRSLSALSVSFFSLKDLNESESLSISFLRERMPLFLTMLPPVNEPPALTIWPSRVTIFKL